jgi:hypothetical protein
MFERTCICGKDYGNNCAHYLANWMIMHGQLDPNPPGAYCCDAGRPLRAKEMRTIFSNTLRLNMHHNAPPGYSYIYCERVADHQGHVYYGTKAIAAAGWTWSGADYYEYYY